MKVFGYMRVSGEGQIDGDGFHRQKETIEDFCRRNKLTLTAFVREEAVSGTTEERPALARLMSEEPDVIVVERLDRLARDLMIQEYFIKEFAKKKISLYSADQGGLIDVADHTADPSRKLLRQIFGAVSEWEKMVFVIKAEKARRRIREETGRCEGRKPFGSNPDKPEEKRICQSVLAGKALGLNYRNIVAAVKTEFGRVLSLNTIHNILRRYGVNGREVRMR